MKNAIRTVGLALALVSGAAAAEQGRMEGNLVAERLAGKWKLDAAATRQIQPGFNENKVFTELQIAADERFVLSIPELAARVASRPTYFVGKWTFEIGGRRWTTPMILGTDASGNPAIFAFELETKGWDSESYIVQLAKAVDPRNDVLYLTGDHSREGVQVLRRRVD